MYHKINQHQTAFHIVEGSLQLGNQCLEDLDTFGWSATYNPCGVTYDENHCEPCVAQPWDHLSPPGFWLLWSTGGEKTWHITGPYNEMNETGNIHEWLVDVPEMFHGASGIDVVFFTYSQYPVRAEYPNNFPRDITAVNPKWDLLTGLYRKQVTIIRNDLFIDLIPCLLMNSYNFLIGRRMLLKVFSTG